MGATDFSTVAVGNDAHDAYRAARDDAYYWHGHGGYTGTIAEKDGFVEFALPEGVTAPEFQTTVWEALSELWSAEGAAHRGDDPEPAPNLATVVRWLGKPAADRLLRVVDDKWGPAVAVRLGADEARRYSPDGDRAAYLFFGMASC